MQFYINIPRFESRKFVYFMVLILNTIELELDLAIDKKGISSFSLYPKKHKYKQMAIDSVIDLFLKLNKIQTDL